MLYLNARSETKYFPNMQIHTSCHRKYQNKSMKKTWLSSTTTQTRLTSVAACHVHKDKLNRVKRKKLAEQFVSCEEGRKITFGSLNERELVICSLVSLFNVTFIGPFYVIVTNCNQSFEYFELAKFMSLCKLIQIKTGNNITHSH